MRVRVRVRACVCERDAYWVSPRGHTLACITRPPYPELMRVPCAPVASQRRLVYAPRWLWASQSHRALGILAYSCSLGAVVSAALKPGTVASLGSRTAAACVVVTAAVGVALLVPTAVKDVRKFARERAKRRAATAAAD
jgi:hypothetical protein